MLIIYLEKIPCSGIYIKFLNFKKLIFNYLKFGTRLDKLFINKNTYENCTTKKDLYC